MVVEKILMSDPDSKSTFVLCKEPSSGEQAVVVLSKKAWTEDAVRTVLQPDPEATTFAEFHRNDKFSKYTAQPPKSSNEVDVTLICPANEIDIAKYSLQQRRLVRETPIIYSRATRPFVEALPPRQTAWVHSILAREKEMEVLLYEDEHCMLLPDTKWDRVDMRACYTLAILKDVTIRSVRDFRGRHAPILRALRDGVLGELNRRYGIRADEVRAYMHYLPSFWQAHVHFAVVSCPTGDTTSVGKALLLDDIIDWLECDGQHFEKASLTIIVGERDPLHARLLEIGALERLPWSPHCDVPVSQCHGGGRTLVNSHSSTSSKQV
jgi:m7GpppX diphosphatase